MTAYLILFIAFVPVAVFIRILLIRFGANKKDPEVGVAMIAGSLAITIICLAYFAFLGLGILYLLGIVDAHRLFCEWHITEANC
jgi:hypothetical protein